MSKGAYMKKFLSLLLSLALLLSCLLVSCAKEEEMTHITISEVTHSVFYAPQYAACLLYTSWALFL